MRTWILALLATAATPAFASSYSLSIGNGGPGATAQTSFAGFNGSLGQLTGITFDFFTGSANFDVKLQSMGPPPPNDTVTYTLNADLFLYLNNGANYQPFLLESGAETVKMDPFSDNFTAHTSGMNGGGSISDATTLAKFIGGQISGYFSVSPTNLQVKRNGVSSFPQQVNAISNFTSAQITYNYLARGESPVPESKTWALLVGGFGMVGGALRSRRRAALGTI
jgi:hypothetical protein